MASESKSQAHITVCRGEQSSGQYAWSPFVTKVEFRLRFAGLSYRTEAGSLSKAPNGKIPYIEITKKESSSGAAKSTSTLADSTLIIQTLLRDGMLEDLNSKLSPADRAHDLAVRALLEEKLYFYNSQEKWHDNYYAMRGHILSALPYPMQIVVGLLIYRKISQTMHGQGTGRLSADEIRSFRYEIWESINALLELASNNTRDDNVPFWVLRGDCPTEADFALYGFIVSVLITTAAPESQKVVRGFPTIVDYARRIHDVYFPDYTLWNKHIP